MAFIADIISSKHNWSYHINPRYFALQALCSLAVELKDSKEKARDHDYWCSYWKGIYNKYRK